MASLRAWRSVAALLLVMVATTGTAVAAGGQRLLAQLAGEAATLTEAAVRAHFSAAYSAVWGTNGPPAVLVAAFRQTIAELGTVRFVGFAFHHEPARRWRWSRARRVCGGAVEGNDSGWCGIGGRRLFVRCTGHGSPTVVFEGGLTSDWYELQNQLSGFMRVCSYDCPGGLGSRSDPAPTPGRSAILWSIGHYRVWRPGRPPRTSSPSCSTPWGS
jgi:hypothetical protein